ncbi:MAG TPA: type II toxin-antitoxin system HipA family toxin, partial [Candidatus Phocaeicola gallistercoris]|nr:type II toxin-antitoxin system HipA family toxin [Candidatus Phocaeicola gallistercoris]
GKRLHTVNMPDIAHEQEQLFINAIQKDDFNAILELRMKGFQPSKNLLKILQPEISSNTFIAIAKIFEMDEMLKDINLSQTPSQTNGEKDMKLKR